MVEVTTSFPCKTPTTGNLKSNAYLMKIQGSHTGVSNCWDEIIPVGGFISFFLTPSLLFLRAVTSTKAVHKLEIGPVFFWVAASCLEAVTIFGIRGMNIPQLQWDVFSSSLESLNSLELTPSNQDTSVIPLWRNTQSSVFSYFATALFKDYSATARILGLLSRNQVHHSLIWSLPYKATFWRACWYTKNLGPLNEGKF